MTEPEILLRALLCAGPRCSREVLQAMAARGFTLKQTRRAREKQCIVIARRGSGRQMRSTWAMPDQPQGAGPVGTSGAVDYIDAFPDRDVHAGAREPWAGPSARATMASLFTPGELLRVERRIEFFGRKGMNAEHARLVAIQLVFGRDRLGSRGGSCLECQNHLHVDAKPCPEGLRPYLEVWDCQAARRDAP